ncbi:MAG TPA: hypothetical protein VNH64_06515 [Parvularculaceae bacterium]|nr:hypothetical protein [Parvularculaceae bacterium]
MRKKCGFIRSDAGVVTIEWIGIAAVALVASVLIAGIVFTGTKSLGSSVANQMSAAADSVSGTTP